MLCNPFGGESKTLVITSLVVWAVACVVDGVYVFGLNTAVLIHFTVILALWLLALSLPMQSNWQRLCVVAGLLISVWLALRANTLLAPVVMVLWVSLVPYLVGKSSSWLVYLCVNSVFLGLTIVLKPQAPAIVTAISFIAFQLFVLASSFLRIELAEQRAQLQESNQRLQHAQALLAETSRNDERLRIAQDLHDNIGQRLTALNLKAELALYKDVTNVKNFVGEIKQDVQNTMAELRSVVHRLKQTSDNNWLQRLQDICATVPGLSFSSDVKHRIDNPLLVEQLLFCFQEAVNNAVKHGGADTIRLYSAERDRAIIFSIADNGSTPVQVLEVNSTGHGIQGMQRRMAVFGGEVNLHIGSGNGDGTELSVTVPKTEFS